MLGLAHSVRGRAPDVPDVVTPACIYSEHNDVAALIGGSNWPSFALGPQIAVSDTITGSSALRVAAPFIMGSMAWEPSALLTFSGSKKFAVEVGATCPRNLDFSSGSAQVVVRFYANDALTSGVLDDVYIGRSVAGGIRIFSTGGINQILSGSALSDDRFLVWVDSSTKKVNVRYAGVTYTATTAPLAGKAGCYVALLGNTDSVTGAAIGKTLSATMYTSSQDWTIAPDPNTYDLCGGLVSGYVLDESGNYIADTSGNRLIWVP